MSQKAQFTWAALIGSTVGGFIPYLWGDYSFLSFAGIIWSTIGAVAGLVIVYKFFQNG